MRASVLASARAPGERKTLLLKARLVMMKKY
jgi:hypothetical protein